MGEVFLCGFMFSKLKKKKITCKVVSSGMAKIKKHARLWARKILKYQQIQKEKRLLCGGDIPLILTVR